MLLAILAFIVLGLTVACEEDAFDELDDSLADSGIEPLASTSYNTIEECKARLHPGEPWKSLCDRHGGWGNPNAAAAGRTCKRIDCERNAEHDVSVYFWTNGCYCKDGYRGPDPDEGLEPLPPGCEDAKRGKITFCQKNETCRGTGTRTLKNYSCRDVNKGFAALVCSGMFSDNDWKKMRADCCFDPNDDAVSVCTPLHQTCKTTNDCCKGLECKVRVFGQPPICSATSKPTRTRITDGHGGAGGR